MRVTLSKTKNAEHVYISKAYRNENGKSTSKIFKKLGTVEELLPLHDNDREKVLQWAKEQARFYTEAEKNDTLNISLKLSETRQLTIGEMTLFEGGYLFLQKLFYETGIGEACKTVSKNYDFQYNLSSLLSNLVCSRILSPSSKMSSYEYMNTMIEKPDFSLHDIYRALDVIDKESDNIQSLIYKNGINKRNTSVLYYDCTNFFFETEDESGIRKYGKSKEHRPNPIVQMGLFLDGDGIPLAFTIFPGNENEQPTLIPLEEKILKDYDLSKFIVCTDAGLASYANRKFNNKPNRAFVVTQSIKTLPKHIKEWALSPEGFRLPGDGKEYDISEIDEDVYRNSVFHKERWINEKGIEQRLVVSYSVKYRNYQREIRRRQIDRAAHLINGNQNKTRNINSPSRFIEEIQLTMDGEVAEKCIRTLNTSKIAEEEMYDGFYAVCTTLEDDINTIIKINRRRWEIEESFRIMKSEFKARPVYVQKDERIRAHFMTCFLALIVFRTLEKKLDEKYTVSEIIRTLQGMKFQKIKGVGYIPCYTRTEITDALHEAFGFRTDKQIVTEKKMKEIIKSSKK